MGKILCKGPIKPERGVMYEKGELAFTHIIIIHILCYMFQAVNHFVIVCLGYVSVIDNKKLRLISHLLYIFMDIVQIMNEFIIVMSIDI